MEEEQICSCCKTSSADFVRTGLLGCADCYRELACKLDPVIARMFGHTTHCGKTAEDSVADYTVHERIAMLEVQLRLAAREDRFSEAARFKAQIDALKAGLAE